MQKKADKTERAFQRAQAKVLRRAKYAKHAKRERTQMENSAL